MNSSRRFLFRVTDPDHNPTRPVAVERPEAPKLFPVDDWDQYSKLVCYTQHGVSYVFADGFLRSRSKNLLANSFSRLPWLFSLALRQSLAWGDLVSSVY